MNAAQLLPLVQQAQASGIQYLVLPNHYIPVDEALRWKASYEEKLVTACNYIEQYRSNPTQYGVTSGLIRIRSIVRSAAHDFCIYLRDLCILMQPADWPPFPKELEAYPEFQEYWNGGFATAYLASGEIHNNLARYGQVGNFPLYVALEGKNRVDLFRRRGKAIKAMVTKWNYPKAEYLTLHCSLPFRTYYLCCHDEHFLSNRLFNKCEVLAYPEISLPILHKYGVKHGKGICIKPLSLKDIFDVRRRTCSALMAG